MPAGTATSSPAGWSASRALIDKVRMMRNMMGGICDPNTAWMLLRSLETLELRMTRAGENAAKVCAFLRDHPKVETVGYLGFLEEGSRQADIYNRHCTGAGSTFSLYLKGGEREAFAFLDALQIAHLAVSLGGTETLASAPAAMTHLSVPDERKTALGITDNLVRISIGVEDADDLIADFANALNADLSGPSPIAALAARPAAASPNLAASRACERRSLPCGLTATGSSAHSKAGASDGMVGIEADVAVLAGQARLLDPVGDHPQLGRAIAFSPSIFAWTRSSRPMIEPVPMTSSKPSRSAIASA